MKNIKVSIVAVGILLVCIGIGLIVSNTNKFSTSQVQNIEQRDDTKNIIQITNTPTESLKKVQSIKIQPSPTPDPYEGWKKYTSKDLNLTFYYRSDFRVYENNDEISIDLLDTMVASGFESLFIKKKPFNPDYKLPTLGIKVGEMRTLCKEKVGGMSFCQITRDNDFKGNLEYQVYRNDKPWERLVNFSEYSYINYEIPIYVYYDVDKNTRMNGRFEEATMKKIIQSISKVH
ncbi:MAG: hypothetical protein WCO06_03025 [Candidatus Roizmanbacteria bacterium]